MSGVNIREVWAGNLAEEMAAIAEVVERYNHIALDTEFPGVVARPVGAAGSDYQYQTLRVNVDLLKIIQLGLTFSDEAGNMPEDVQCWQFNFHFSLASDIYAADAIELLTQAGIDFAQHERHGIDVAEFGELLTSSGVVLNEEVSWVSFHSGFDFGYLLKVLTSSALPAAEADFLDLLATYFPRLYDMKYLMLASDKLYGGLNKLAEIYHVDRHGQMHQAGSDSLVTLHVFLRMKEETFRGAVPLPLAGILFGLGSASSTLPGLLLNGRGQPAQTPEGERAAAAAGGAAGGADGQSQSPPGKAKLADAGGSKASALGLGVPPAMTSADEPVAT